MSPAVRRALEARRAGAEAVMSDCQERCGGWYPGKRCFAKGVYLYADGQVRCRKHPRKVMVETQERDARLVVEGLK
jgi:hypothetical protein